MPAVTSDGPCFVCSNASSFLIHAAQVVLTARVALRHCKAVQSHSLGIVPRNTPTCIVAFSYHKLSKVKRDGVTCAPNVAR